MSRFLSLLFPAVAMLGAMAGSPALAQTGTGAGTSAAGQGAVVVRDAESGQVRAPTAAEMRALQPAASASAKSSASQARPAIVTGPGGRRSVRLDERHMVYSVVTRSAEGRHGAHCVTGKHAADHALSAPAPTTMPEEHHEDH